MALRVCGAAAGIPRRRGPATNDPRRGLPADGPRGLPADGPAGDPRPQATGKPHRSPWGGAAVHARPVRLSARLEGVPDPLDAGRETVRVGHDDDVEAHR